MDDISIVQFGDPLQTSFEYLLPSVHRDFFLDQVQKVVVQVLIYEDTLVWDGIQWQSYVWATAELRPDVLVETREYVFGNILQDKFILSGSAAMSVHELDMSSKGVRTLPTKHGRGVVSPGSAL